MEKSFERAYSGSRMPHGYPSLPEGWHSQPFTFVSADGSVKLFSVLHRKTDQPVRRLLAVLHGFGEHGGRYQHFPHFLQEKYDAIFVLDHRGHGRSEGQRGDCARFDSLVDDFLKALDDLLAGPLAGESPAVEILGHSLGGHLALRMAYLHPERPFAAYHISAPFLALRADVSPLKRMLAKGIARIWGTLSLGADFDASVLSRDPHVVEHYLADRLNHSRMTPRMFVSMNAAMQDTLKNFRRCEKPMQFLIPPGDPLVDSVTSKKFFAALECPGKQLVEFDEGFRHEPMQEIGKEKFFEAILKFPEEK